MNTGECKCYEKYFQEAATGNCQSCDPMCKTCRDGQATSCLSCKGTSQLSSGTCVCPPGQIITTGGYCNTCHNTCFGCGLATSMLPTSCANCQANALKQTDKSCKCNPGYYMSSTGICVICSAICAECTDGTSCTVFKSSVGYQYDPSTLTPSCNSLTQYWDQGTNSCKSCHPTCATCSGPAINQCTKCPQPEGTTLVNGECKCVSRYVMYNNVCSECHNQCNECVYPNIYPNAPHHQCIDCKQNDIGSPASTGNINCGCASGYTRDGPSGNCYPNGCARSCRTCFGLGDNQCLSCNPNSDLISATKTCDCRSGYGWNEATQCVLCDKSCLTCDKTGNKKCLSCRANAILSGDRCNCMDGWYFSNVTYTCELCHPICKTCYGPDPNNCLTCDPLATLYRSTCSCPSTKYKTSTNTCEDCSLSCLNCVSSPTYCTSCREPKILSGSTCVCPDSHYTDVDGNCYPYVCHPSCLTCKGTTSSDCTSCTKSYEYYMNSFQCKCIEGYFMHTDGKCYPCDNKCQTCAISPTNCLTCNAPAILVPSGTTSTCQCPSTHLFNNIGLCQARPCAADCSLCEGIASPNCLICFDQRAVTVPNPGPGICSCPATFFLTKNYRCQSCFSQCRECSYPNFNSFTCTACNPPSTLFTPTSGSATCTCGLGKFMDGAGQCQNCHFTCKDCTGVNADSCISCKSSLAILSVEGCRCSSGLHFDSNGECQSIECHPSCATCNGLSSTNCLSCHSSATLSANACTCPAAGTYMSTHPSSKGQCQPCDPSCATCTGPLSTECMTCTAPAFMSSTGECLCPATHFMDQTTGKCSLAVCHISCLSCGSASTLPTDCLSCRPDAFLTGDGKCECQIGKYMDSLGVCQPCHARCRSCFDAGESSCTACFVSSYLDSDNKCKCIAGYEYATSSDATCSLVTCDPTCLTCYGTLPTQCLTCSSSRVLTSAGSCSCLLNTYQVPAPQTCALCYERCIGCIGPLNNDCNVCKEMGVLTLWGCECRQEYYFDSTLSVCSPCHSSCLACKGKLATQCTGCREGWTLATDGTCNLSNGFVLVSGQIAANSRCHITCLQCKGPSQNECTACTKYATVDQTGRCFCKEGMKMNPTTGKCEVIVCHPACFTCEDNTLQGCTSCKPFARLQAYPVGKCSCDPGLGYNPVTFDCEPCFQTCKTCDTTLNNSCTSCVPSLTQTPLQGGISCQCPLSTGLDLPSLQCTNCSLPCRSCLLATDDSCLTCKSGNIRTSDNQCKCVEGFGMTPLGTCSSGSCDYRCLTCSGANLNQCLTCRKGAYLSSDGGCVCRSGAPMDRSGECIQCDPSCAFCEKGAPNKCTKCYALATLQSDGKCICKEGYYFDVDFLACLVCHITCRKCSGKNESQCTSCRDGATLDSTGRCNCLSGVQMTIDGSCVSCPTVCKTCRSDGRCASCNENAQLDSLNGCKCNAGFYMSKVFKCEVCHPKCSSCTGPDELDCITCAGKGYYDYYTSSCICLGATYYEQAVFDCVNCNEALHCLTCSSSDSCTSCQSGYTITFDKVIAANEQTIIKGLCNEVKSNKGPFDYSISILHDQIFLQISIPDFTPQSMAQYLQAIISPSLISITKEEGEPKPEKLSWTPLMQSEYEWMRGLIRFRINIEQGGIEAFKANIIANPKISPTKWSQTKSRVLENTNSLSLTTRALEQLELNDQPKSYLFPAYSTVSAFTSSLAYYLGVVLQTVQILVMIFLVGVRPLSQNMRTDPKSFWVVGSVQWMQLWMLLGYTATELRGGLDELILNIAKASLRWVSFDTQISWLDGKIAEDLRRAVYLGKYTGTDSWPHVLACLAIPSGLYIVLWLVTLIGPKLINPTVISMRYGLGMSFIVQFAFLCSLNISAVFRSQIFTIYTLAGLFYSFLLLVLLFLDLFLLKKQLLSQSSLKTLYLDSQSTTHYVTHPSTFCILSFDIERFELAKRMATIKRAMFDETDCMLYSSICLGGMGTRAVLQSTLIFLLAVLLVVNMLSTAMVHRTKWTRLLQAAINLCIWALILGFSITRRDIPLKIIDFLNWVIGIGLMMAAAYVLAILVLRVIRIIKTIKKAIEKNALPKSPVENAGMHENNPLSINEAERQDKNLKIEDVSMDVSSSRIFVNQDKNQSQLPNNRTQTLHHIV
jgi:hypothetical protein